MSDTQPSDEDQIRLLHATGYLSPLVHKIDCLNQVGRDDPQLSVRLSLKAMEISALNSALGLALSVLEADQAQQQQRDDPPQFPSNPHGSGNPALN